MVRSSPRSSTPQHSERWPEDTEAPAATAAIASLTQLPESPNLGGQQLKGSRMKRAFCTLALAAGALIAAPASSGAATGHHCTIGGTCRYYTSSYHTAYLIYAASNPDWKSLSKTYLQGYRTWDAVKDAYPHRTLDTDG